MLLHSLFWILILICGNKWFLCNFLITEYVIDLAALILLLKKCFQRSLKFFVNSGRLFYYERIRHLKKNLIRFLITMWSLWSLIRVGVWSIFWIYFHIGIWFYIRFYLNFDSVSDYVSGVSSENILPYLNFSSVIFCLFKENNPEIRKPFWAWSLLNHKLNSST